MFFCGHGVDVELRYVFSVLDVGPGVFLCASVAQLACKLSSIDADTNHTDMFVANIIERERKR